MRPNSSGGPLYLSRSGRTSEALTVSVGNFSGAPARTTPGASGTGNPSSVIGFGAVDILLHHVNKGRLTGSNGVVEVLDRGFDHVEFL